jgi:cytochrome P450
MTAQQTEPLSATKDRSPYAHYVEARKRGVYFDEHDQAWIASTYDDVKTVCIEEDVFARVKPHEVVSAEKYIPIIGARHASGLVGAERIEHRKWWLSLFTRSKVEAYRTGLVTEVIQSQIDRIQPLGKAELVEDYSGRLSLRVIAGLLGLPWHDEEWMVHIGKLFDVMEEWKAMAYLIPNEAQVLADEALAATEESTELMRPYLEAQLAAGGDSIVSQIWNHPSLANWTEPDRYDTARTFFGAGSSSTKATLANGLYMLLTEPDVKEKVASGDADVVANFCEEILRFNGAVQYRTRKATTDTELGGQPIARGDKVITLLASANRDETQYPRADEIDLDRRNPRSHVGFLTGLGTCAGAGLARVELQEGVAQLLNRLPNIQLDPSAEPPVMAGMGVRAFSPLNVTFTSTEQR